MTLADLIKRAEWLVANRPPAEAVDLLRSWTPSAASALKDMGQALKETLELIAAVNALSDGISERLETKPSPQKYGVPFGLVNDLNAAAKKVEASKPAQAEARHIATGADIEWQAKIFHAEMDKLGVPRDDGEDFYSLIGRANLALEAAGRVQQAEPVAWAATSDEGKVEALGFNQSRRFDTPLYLAAPTAQEASRPMTLADAAKSFPNGPFGQPHIEASKPVQAHYETQPDGVVTEVDPTDRGFKPVQVAQDLTDEEISAIWSEEDQPSRKSKLSAFGMQRIRAIIRAARASGQEGETK